MTILRLAVLALGLSSFAACGGSSKKDTEKPSGSEMEEKGEEGGGAMEEGGMEEGGGEEGGGEEGGEEGGGEEGDDDGGDEAEGGGW